MEYGSGEPSQTADPPGTSTGSRSNPDPFLHTNPYDEPIYETRLECTPDFAWQNAKCPPDGIAAAVTDQVKSAAGIIFMAHNGHVSSCSGTLIAGDLFLTARHCLTDPAGEDVRSASVTFDYMPNCDGTRPPGHAPRFFKVVEEVASGGPTGVDNPPASTDWVVVRLSAEPGSLPAPLDMRPNALMSGETIFSMHHPGGSVKKTQTITYDGDSTINGFDFAGGSSGSALFDANGRLVGGALSKGPLGSACSVLYSPIQAVINAFENPPPPPNPLDVMVVFDKSGSMGSSAPPSGRTKLEEAQDAASLFVQLVREGAGDRLGLVTFSSSSALNAAPAPAAAAKPDLVGATSPFDGGEIGDITSGGSTSIGAGVDRALGAMAGTTNDRAILLLSDGLQNTPPMIEGVEDSLGDTRLCVIGFGSDAQIDGPLLSRIAREHGGQFTRAIDGLSLRKFFGLCFGDIFEDGALSDPNRVLRASQEISRPEGFDVCGEERITVVLGWDSPATPLRMHIKTPKGRSLGSKGVEAVRGRTWAFWRIPLPHRGERDGRWTFTVDRVPTGGEFPPPPTDVSYFVLVVCSGGPKLKYLGGQKRVYTGDRIDPLVGLHYPNGTTPHDAKVHLTITAPTRALGSLVQEEGLSAPLIDGDAVGAFHATLQSIEKKHGTLPVSPDTMTVPLYDDGIHDDGAMEPDGVFNHPLTDFTLVEGTYEFHAVATYGHECRASREAFWAVHVEPGIDPDGSDISIVDEVSVSDGKEGTLCIVPRDKYGNPLGPGRRDLFRVGPLHGVTLKGPVKESGDGSYCVDVTWDPGKLETPGLIVEQDYRPPGVYMPPSGARPCDKGEADCADKAKELLECIGLPESDVKKVRIKSVCLEVRMKDPDC